MIFGHLVWDLIQVLRGRAPNDVICHRPWPSKNRPHVFGRLGQQKRRNLRMKPL
ncbi:unnamed protein product [Sphagnum jensenii]|uniref:Uncharacterized protein n=1 Tax=Sphagnum jensenii TaxID=128206 RepID=A0ABP0VVG8_9BRYO